MKQVVKTDNAPKPVGPYSQAVRSGNLVFVAGQGCLNPKTGEKETGSVQAETRQVLENVNRVGNALREMLGVRLEERVLLLLLDCPEFVYSFFGAIKIGAVAVPVNTLMRSEEYAFLLDDSRARVVVAEPAAARIIREVSKRLISEFSVMFFKNRKTIHRRIEIL